MSPQPPRHSRHHLFAGIGRDGQEKLEHARVAIVGCGALGSRSAELLARAGVGRGETGILRIIDRDYVDETNLQRQALFDSDDAQRARPKASAAAKHIARIDAGVRVEPLVRDVNAANVLDLLAGFDLILDGSDNFGVRFLINDAALQLGTPWIYAGAVGSHGVVAMIDAPRTPCFRCLLESMPPLGVADTCDTAGIITPLPAIVVGVQTAIALKYLVSGVVTRGLTLFDAWVDPGVSRRVLEETTASLECRSCGTRELPALTDNREETVTLCGRNSVQLVGGATADLDAATQRLRESGEVHRHDESVTVTLPEHRLTLFRDGRIVVEGTTDSLEAKALAARYLS